LKSAATGGDYSRDRLVEELTRNHSFLLAGDRRYFFARAALAEASPMALDDIKNCVGNVRLMRPRYIAAVHNALDKGHYVEIRGNGGVGKSGVLRHFAEEITAEAPVIVLSPGRTTPGGWQAMRAMLGFDGDARELLLDLVGSGSRILFIDNLDSFDEKEQLTVIDLVRKSTGLHTLTFPAGGEFQDHLGYLI
jgi:hypothetical protein